MGSGEARGGWPGRDSGQARGSDDDGRRRSLAGQHVKAPNNYILLPLPRPCATARPSPCPALRSVHNRVASRRGEQSTSHANTLVYSTSSSSSSDTPRPRPRPPRTTLMISSRNYRAALAIRDLDRSLPHPPLVNQKASTTM